MVYTKKDGIVKKYKLTKKSLSTWSIATQNSNLGSRSWYALAYDGTKFVALGYQGYISTSTDGTTWTSATRNAKLKDNYWISLVYANNSFTALDKNGYISTSTDGTTWSTPSRKTALSSNSWDNITYGDGKYVAIGSSGYISTCTNGTWTTASYKSNLGSNAWQSIAYDGTKFVAISSTGYISTSTNGTTWTTAAQNSNLGSNGWRGITYDGTKFVAISFYGHISTSTDGTDWEVAIQKSNLGNNLWLSLAYDGMKFVALGRDGYISITELLSNKTYTLAKKQADMTSDNSSFTTTTNTYIEGMGTDHVLYIGNMFLSISAYGYYMTSLDGVTWTTPKTIEKLSSSNYSNRNWNWFAYNGGRFVVVNSYGQYAASNTSYTDWYYPSYHSSFYLGYDYADRYISPKVLFTHKNKFILLSNDFSIQVGVHILTSEDGIEWSVPSLVDSFNIDNSWKAPLCVTYDGNKYICLLAGGYVSTSTNGEQWSTPISIGYVYQSIIWDGTQYIGLNGSHWSTSTDLINWTPLTNNAKLNGNNYANNLCCVNNYVYGFNGPVIVGSTGYGLRIFKSGITIKRYI